MLKVKRIGEPSQNDLIFIEDHYIYVDFGYQIPPLYWSNSDAPQELLEIGLEADTGQIVSFNLLGIRELINGDDTLLGLASWDIPQWQGVPICDLRSWGGNKTNRIESNPMRLRISPQSIAIELGDRNMTASCITSGKVSFGVEKNGNLSVIEIMNLSKRETAFIREVFEEKISSSHF